MRILFSSAQLPGHLDWGGYLATAAALAQRGHAARWVSGAAVERQVLAAGGGDRLALAAPVAPGIAGTK